MTDKKYKEDIARIQEAAKLHGNLQDDTKSKIISLVIILYTLIFSLIIVLH